MEVDLQATHTNKLKTWQCHLNKAKTYIKNSTMYLRNNLTQVQAITELINVQNYNA
jgi:hypothetical protein